MEFTGIGGTGLAFEGLLRNLENVMVELVSFQCSVCNPESLGQRVVIIAHTICKYVVSDLPRSSSNFVDKVL